MTLEVTLAKQTLLKVKSYLYGGHVLASYQRPFFFPKRIA